MITRRKLLRGGAALTGAGLLGAAGVRARRGEPVVAVVGAGLAGLTCAYRLQRTTSARVLLFEAQEHTGGRTRTIRTLPGGQIAERGGTFISSGDRAIRDLASRLGVGLIDLDERYPRGRTVFHFGGSPIGRAELMADRKETARRAARQFRRISWPVDPREPGSGAIRFDNMSIAEWIDRYTPGGAGSPFGRYLRVYMETDYGTPVETASALHVIAEFAAPGRSYDERFIVRGGTDRLVRALRRRLEPGTLATGAPLVAAEQRSKAILTFDGDGGAADLRADRVVLALPFTALRVVDLSGAGLSRKKRVAIDGLGMGRGAKISAAFQPDTVVRPFSGVSFSDLVTGSTWPGHAGMAGDGQILVSLTAEAPVASEDSPIHGRAGEPESAEFLDAVDTLFPGAGTRVVPGEVYLDDWVRDPWAGGTYSYYPTGGFTSYAGIEQRPEGRFYFAGEHTASYGNRGTMNGAVASGIAAADAIRSSL